MSNAFPLGKQEESTEAGPPEFQRLAYYLARASVGLRRAKIYGFLVGKTLGKYPSRGVLVPLGGASIEVPLVRNQKR